MLAEQALVVVGPRGWVCLTGGEPAEHADFEQVVAACRRRGLQVNLQTSWIRREPWAAGAGPRSADAWLVFVQIRYNLP